MGIEVILGSVVISTIISGLISIYTTCKTNKIEHITKERSKWREEIRKCSEELRGASYQNTLKICDRLKDRINAFGKRTSNRYSADAHIWKVINEIESDDFHLEDLSRCQMRLQEYLSLLLKWDWERSKKEVSFEKARVVQWILWIASVGTYAISLFCEYRLGDGEKNFSIEVIMACVTLAILVILLILYVEQQLRDTCFIMFVGHVVKKHKSLSWEKYVGVFCVNLVLTVAAMVGYGFFLVFIVKNFGIELTNRLVIGILDSFFMGAGAIVLFQYCLTAFASRYYNYAHAIDLIQEEDAASDT